MQDNYDKFDYEFCGTELPHIVVSEGPRLAMVFSSGELQARGFKVSVITFENSLLDLCTRVSSRICGEVIYLHCAYVLMFTSRRLIIHSKLNTKYLARPHQMVLVPSRIRVRHVKKANLIVPDFLLNIYLVSTTIYCP